MYGPWDCFRFPASKLSSSSQPQLHCCRSAATSWDLPCQWSPFHFRSFPLIDCLFISGSIAFCGAVAALFDVERLGGCGCSRYLWMCETLQTTTEAWNGNGLHKILAPCKKKVEYSGGSVRIMMQFHALVSKIHTEMGADQCQFQRAARIEPKYSSKESP